MTSPPTDPLDRLPLARTHHRAPSTERRNRDDRPEDGPEHEPELHESPLSAADDERIRRLLADARHTEPVPEAVATRLDEVLAGLSAERADQDAHEDRRAPVIDLAARRRRTAANLLVAAAAVLVVGFGISQVLPNGMSGGAADRGHLRRGRRAPGDSADSGGGEGSRNAQPEAGPEGPAPTEYDGGAAGKAFQIRSERFGADVRRLRTQLLQDRSQALVEYPAPECLTADVGAGEVVAATYDDAPAAIVLRSPSGDVQVVDLYLCGDAAPRRSITLTAPSRSRG